MLEIDTVAEWLSTCKENWKGAWKDKKLTIVFFNLRNFIRSLYLQLITDEELKHKEVLENLVLEMVKRLRPW